MEVISVMQQVSAASTIRFFTGHRVAMKTMANSDAIAVRLQKICMGLRQCRQNSSIQAMTIAALPIIV